MRHPALFPALFALLVCVALPTAADDTVAPKGGKRDGPALPRDPKTVMVTLDWQGGFTPRRENAKPYLVVLRDGTVRANEPFDAKAKPVSIQIGEEELLGLMRFLDEQRFFAFDADAVRKELAKEGNDTPAVLDAASTVVTAWRAGKMHEARWYALRYASRQHAKCASLQRLVAVVARLQALRHATIAGGADEAAALAKRATEHLRKEVPGAAALTLDDLADARVRGDGTRAFRFFRADERGSTQTVSITLPADEDADPQVSVHLTPGR